MCHLLAAGTVTLPSNESPACVTNVAIFNLKKVGIAHNIKGSYSNGRLVGSGVNILRQNILTSNHDLINVRFKFWKSLE